MRISEIPSGVEISFSLFGLAWPIAHKKLLANGIDSEVILDRRKPTLVVSAGIDEVSKILEPRINRKVKLWKFAWIPVLAISIPLSFLPVEKPKTIQHKTVVDNCSVEKIRAAIIGEPNVEITKMSETKIGGVTVGLISCQGSKYKYTLAGNSNERVLNLEKLDS